MQLCLIQRWMKPRPCQYKNLLGYIDGPINLSVFANTTPEVFALSGVYCNKFWEFLSDYIVYNSYFWAQNVHTCLN